MVDTLDANKSRSRKSVNFFRIELLSRFKAEFLCMFSAIFLVCVFYSKVLLGKIGLSRFCLLAEWDSVFQQFSTGKAAAFDPSLVQLLIPNYFLKASFWHKLELPLWNSYSATGVPLLADIQATALSPLHLFLDFGPSMFAYNFTLVGEIWLAVVGSYLFARQVGLRPLYALVCSALYSFCPYNLYYIELLSGTSAAILPLLLWSFLLAAKQFTGKTLALSALGSAAYVLSGHPESSLYGISVACGLFLFWPLSQKSFGRRCLELTGIGSLALALASPVVLPFIEYLKVGESYKYAGGISAFAPWQGLILNLLSPCLREASPYLGVLTLPALAALFYLGKPSCNRKVIWFFTLSAVLSLLLIARVGFLHDLLQCGSLTYLITIYLIPTFLLCLTVLVSIGLSELSSAFRGHFPENREKQFVALVILAAGCIFVLALTCLLVWSGLELNQYNFDATLATLMVNKHNLLNQAILVAIYLFLVAGLAVQKAKFSLIRRHRHCLFDFLTIAVVLAGLFTFNQRSLPAQRVFDLPRPEIITYLASHEGRVLPLADHLLKANANIIYGISSFRIHNPLLPARFTKYAEACGARVDEFHNQHYEVESVVGNKFIDAASIRYLISQFKSLPSPYCLKYTSKEGIQIYENPGALPEVYACSNLTLVRDGCEALAKMQATAFKPQDEVIVETEGSGAESVDFTRVAHCKTGASGIVPEELLSLSNNHLQVRTDAQSPTFLCFTRTYYPGWSAYIDGKQVLLYRANYLFEGLVLPAGKHVVDLLFFPEGFKLGIILSLIGGVIIGFLFFKKEASPL